MLVVAPWWSCEARFQRALDFGGYRTGSLVPRRRRTARTTLELCSVALNYRYPRSEPATALLIPARRDSFSGHPSVVGVKTGRNSSDPHISAR